MKKNNLNGKEWLEGSLDEWIFVWSKDEKVLLLTYADGDFNNITRRLVKDNGETYSTKAEKIAFNVGVDEIEDAVGLLIYADSIYDFIRIDYSNRKDVRRLIKDCSM